MKNIDKKFLVQILAMISIGGGAGVVVLIWWPSPPKEQMEPVIVYLPPLVTKFSQPIDDLNTPKNRHKLRQILFEESGGFPKKFNWVIAENPVDTDNFIISSKQLKGKRNPFDVSTTYLSHFEDLEVVEHLERTKRRFGNLEKRPLKLELYQKQTFKEFFLQFSNDPIDFPFSDKEVYFVSFIANYSGNAPFPLIIIEIFDREHHSRIGEMVLFGDRYSENFKSY